MQKSDQRDKGIALDGESPRYFGNRLAAEQATTRLWVLIAEAAGERAIVAEQRATAAERRAMRAERALAGSRHQPWQDLAMIAAGVLLAAAVLWVTGVRFAGGPL